MGKALKGIGITLMIAAIAQLVFQILVMSVPIYNGRGAGSRNINIQERSPGTRDRAARVPDPRDVRSYLQWQRSREQEHLTNVVVTGNASAEVRMTGWYNVDVTTGRDSEGWGALISILLAIALFVIGNKVRCAGNQ
jgi:hypothetical protein